MKSDSNSMLAVPVSVLYPKWVVFMVIAFLALAGLFGSFSSLRAQSNNVLSPLSQEASRRGQAGWRPVGIPGGKVPLTSFQTLSQAGKLVLALKSRASYGTWVHDLDRIPVKSTTIIGWHWRVEEGVQNANLTTKAGDDAAVKVCVSFDMPTDGLGLSEKALLRLARAVTGEALPAATLCYVWDAQLANERLLANAYTKRVRFIVLDGQKDVWRSFRRNVEKDFLRAFGKESPTVPPIIAVLIGADSDNTQGSSSAFVADVELTNH